MALSAHGVVQNVKQDLLSRLGSQWVVGQWLPPVGELSRLLNAGHGSTHAAVRELTHEGYLLPLRGKGTRVLKAAPGAKPGATTIASQPRVAIVRFRNTDAMIHRMVDAFMDAAKPLNPRWSFELLDVDAPNGSLSEDVDAAVLFNAQSMDDLSGVLSRSRHVIAVSAGLGTWSETQPQVDRISIDQDMAGYLAGQCLRDAGCETACYIGRHAGDRSRYDATSQQRLRGFVRAWGSKLKREHLMFGRYYGELTGSHALRRWVGMSPRPQGIFAASDDLAVGMLSAALERGLKPGVDFHLVGVDGQDRGRSVLGVALTTVVIPAEAMGRHAARLLRQRWSEGETDPVHMVLGCRLQHGQTVALLPRPVTPDIERPTSGKALKQVRAAVSVKDK